MAFKHIIFSQSVWVCMRALKYLLMLTFIEMRMELLETSKIYAKKLMTAYKGLRPNLECLEKFFVCNWNLLLLLLLLSFLASMYTTRATAYQRKIVEYTSMSIKVTATQPNQHSSSPQCNIAKYILENKPQITDDGNDSGNKQ